LKFQGENTVYSLFLKRNFLYNSNIRNSRSQYAKGGFYKTAKAHSILLCRHGHLDKRIPCGDNNAFLNLERDKNHEEKKTDTLYAYVPAGVREILSGA
jgi:hypothetical protein